MSETQGPIDERELHAYVDGRLTAQRRAAIEAHLARTPEDAARVAAWRAQTEALCDALDPVLGEPLPLRLLRRPRAKWWGHAGRAAAAALLLAIGGAAGWWLAERAPEPALAMLDDLAARAAVAHAVYEPEIRHPVEVRAEESHLAGWLSKRLGAEIRAPDLAAAGWRLIGGRLLPGARSPAAQFMYENATGRRITIYLRVEAEDNRETAFLWRQDGDLVVCYWLDGPTGWAIAGRAPWAEIEHLARLVYEQVS